MQATIRLRHLLFSSVLTLGLLGSESGDIHAGAQPLPGPAIGTITVQTPGEIEKYAKFEVSFQVTTVATNPYFPYDPSPPPGIERRGDGKGTGITVSMMLLPPGQSNWIKDPCFYFQPYEDLYGRALVPFGPADWRCRFAPEAAGNWQYRIQAEDAEGVSVGPIGQFTAIDPNPDSPTRKGFIRVSQSDPRFFEYSDGTPFVAPLINTEQSDYSTLAGIRERVPSLGQNGVRFTRWFANRETGYLVPWGDELVTSSWGYAEVWTNFDDADVERGKKYSFEPNSISQNIPAIPGATYRFSIRAHVTGNKTFRALVGFGGSNSRQLEITDNGGWQSYSFTVTNSSGSTNVTVTLEDRYGSPGDGGGQIRLSEAVLQRDETGSGGWGPNLIERGDANTLSYVDQRNAARMDEVMRLSEQYGVYHKLTLFHKEDRLLTRINPDGSLTEDWDRGKFYSGPGQAARWYEHSYVRYFVARWGYSTALHSLELANECDLDRTAQEAAFAVARLVSDISPRHILMTNSYWGYWIAEFFTDPTNGYLIDYSDKHWYAVDGVTDLELYSNLGNDSAAYARDCYSRLKSYAEGYDYRKPSLQGEGGNMSNPSYSRGDPSTWFHKMVWSHVGALGYSCDGEWWPNYELIYPIFKAYESFISSEPLNNGTHTDIGTDLSGDHSTTSSNSALRAFGSKDPPTTRVLVWVDNVNNTWQNPNYSNSATSTFTITGMPAGSYTRETWDTRAGTHTTTPNAVAVASNGTLQFSASTSKDVAYKFYVPGVVIPTPTPTPPPTQTFADVPPSHPYYREIEALYRAGYTAGCSTNPLMYCPEATMNRAESSVFVERGIHTATYDPPIPASQVFADLALDSWAAKWVNGLWEDQYTAGCGTNPLIFCPWQGHTRAEGCVFYLRMLNGANFEPPQPTQQTFADVPLDSWYAKWVQGAYDAGLLKACQTSPELRFCPNDPLTRALAAYMMVQAKGLQ